ncbi:MAG: TOBE domain-containing protein, partial [Anaerolineae bacterium]|nr:TOBE domain-containing protein [Anaerolineae bacterium]
DITLLKPDQPRQTSARNQLLGQVERVRPAGAQTRVTITCGFTLTALVTRRSVEALALAPGQPVVASFKANAIHLIERS